MKIVEKLLVALGIGVIALVVLSFAGFLFVMFGSNSRTTDDISYYRALSGETDGTDMIPVFGTEFDIPCPYDLPLLSELESASDYRFNYRAKRKSVFQSHAYILIVSYDREEYAVQKLRLDEDYSYETELIPGRAGGVVPQFQLDGFEFRGVSDDEPMNYGGYPKCMFFVGTSDAENEIAYIYFYNQDLDCVAPSLAEFIVRETGWNKVK